MKVTIVPSDNTMIVDGRTIALDLADMQENIHAVQFSGTTGHVEFNDGSPNLTITNLADFQPWLMRWNAAKAVEDAPPPPPTAEQLREQAKAARAAAVNAITVTTTAGNTFDGDETSQTRMARAIIALERTGTPSTIWVLADNSVIQATVAELSEALALAGAAQAAIWVLA